MRIPPETVNEIKSRIDIVDVVGDFVSLKKSGQTFKAISPFTNEKTPSFYVVPAKGIFKDFSSGKGGDAISFVMEYDGLSYTEALKYLAKKYGIEIEERELTDEDLQAENERESIFILLSFARDYYQDRLLNTDEGKSVGLQYFTQRGITTLEIEKFGLGYSPESGESFIKEALRKGFSAEVIEKAGLSNEKGGRTFDRFRGRVMFPIRNQTGKVIAFGARTLKKDFKGAKYINSPETDVYQKSKVLYGLDLAKGAIRKEEKTLLVEGYTDVISLHQIGVENVVASSGTSLTDDQIRLLARYSPNVSVLFDGDPAGLKASIRGIDLMLGGGLNVKAVLLPEGADPDSHSKHLGGYEFQKFLRENEEDFLAFKIKVLIGDSRKDPVKRSEAIKGIVESISKIPDSIKRSVYLKEASNNLEIDESVLITELNKIILRDRKRQPAPDEVIPPITEEFPAEPQEGTAADRIDGIIKRQERENIKSLLKYGLEKLDEDVFLYQYLFEELDEVDFSNPIYEKIFHTFRQGVASNSNFSVKELLQTDDDLLKAEVIDMVTDKYELSRHWADKYRIFIPSDEEILDKKAYTDLLRLKLSKIRRLIQQNMQSLKTADSTSEQNDLQKVHKELKKAEDDIAEILGIVVSK